MEYQPVETGIINLLILDSGVDELVDDRVYPVFIPQGDTAPAITVARVGTQRDPETLESDSVPLARIEIRCISGSYQEAAEIARAVRLALEDVPSMLGEHSVMMARIQDEKDEFEMETAESGGSGFFHRVLVYAVEYYE